MLLLIIIYLTFISLGLPDTIMGAGWPIIHSDLDVPVSSAGILTIISIIGTIISSLLSYQLSLKLGAGKLTAYSVLLTAVALLGISFTPNFYLICLWYIPLGLGAGGVDSAINNYVATNYDAHHMNWLHSMWGVGASLGPIILSIVLNFRGQWTQGFLIISVLQFFLVALIFKSLPQWNTTQIQVIDQEEKSVTINKVIRLQGILPIFIAFFAYCSLEQTAGFWASTYLVGIDIEKNLAAEVASFFYIGITIGRMLSGFISLKLTSQKLIIIGNLIILIGIIGLLLPISSFNLKFISLLFIGLGCSPIYPAIIHLTPQFFGKNISQAIIGVQMAVAYLGFLFAPPLMGLLAQWVTVKILPIYLLIFSIILFLMSLKFINFFQNKGVI